ncbi:PepSY-associated TM helix domain-containing protein [Paenibacillus eucommiae]|uniref:Iron-regulated membrane protein n=1 Tax=Paenibacillus eucommiae TaxID=1355755 RepID=A0ABS4IPT2_9BACL|nr:PepSY domain-containing protein [Paenibacillus eucommiae]MBP1989518.1 putative iron-regulated membrane protein [Paenibacillus eucommiae]
MSARPTEHFKPSTPQARKKTAAKWLPYLYQSVWRWHFYAGIIFAPFLIILAFSGSMYLFKPQIEGYLYKDMLTVREVGSAAMPYTDLIEKTVRAYPGTSISSITLTDNLESTIKLSASRNGTATTMYADPYTGNITGMLNSDKTFSAFFKKMHSQLLLKGTWANRLVELSACWAVILTVTGLYLWWPRNKAAIWGTILPRLGKRGSRTFWRDIHAVPAFWLSLCMLVLIASGLPWSGVLGGQIDRLANATNTNYPPFALSFLAKPESVTVAKDIADDVPWAVENVPVPVSASGGYLPLNVNEIASIADKQSVRKPYTISMPQGETGVYTISTAHERPGRDATLHVDLYSGAVLTDVRYGDYGIMAKVISLGIALHEGRLFGVVNQMLGLLTCMGVILIAISSYFMWRKRKPDGKLGAPEKPKDKRFTIGVLGIMLIFGILMPLVGLSILVILILDLLVIQRIRPLKQWFSA